MSIEIIPGKKERRFKGSTPYNTFRRMVGHLFPFVDDYTRAIITAYQRITRKWADEDVWSIDWFLCDILPPMLEQLKKTKHGVPQKYIDKANELRGIKAEMWDPTPDDIFAFAEQLWEASVDKMIAGFVAHKRLMDYDYETKEDVAKLQETFKEGMSYFVDDFANLWD